MNEPKSLRIESIDILRGLTILVMLFVNDLAGVPAPAWMKHLQPPDADGMTFVDVVFPAFLFIVGLAIPFSFKNRHDKGDHTLEIWKHVMIRVVSLLVIGVLMVNTESISSEGLLPPQIWILLMYLGVILIWNRWSPARRRIMQGSGIVLLLALAFLYRGQGEPGLMELRPQWWGIIGLIGWAYLVACAVYTLLGRNVAGLVGAMALLYCVFCADKAGYFSQLGLITSWVSIGSMLGSHAAITVSGVILGVMLLPDAPLQTHTQRLRWAILYGLGLALAGHLLHTLNQIHPMFIINKIQATPPWCLWSCAITVWIWAAVYHVVDVKGWKGWTPLVEPAGGNALFAYILAPILYAVFQLIALAGLDFYTWLGQSFAVGFPRSVVFAFAMTWLAGGLKHFGVQLKL